VRSVRGRLKDSFGLPTAGGDLLKRVIFGEDDQPSRSPRGSPKKASLRRSGFTDCQHRSVTDRDLLQFVARNESDPLTIGREEWRFAILRPRDRNSGNLIERAPVELCGRSGLTTEDEYSAIGRECGPGRPTVISVRI